LDIYILFLGLDSGPVAPKTLHRVPGGYLRKIRYFYASINLQLKVQCSYLRYKAAKICNFKQMKGNGNFINKSK